MFKKKCMIRKISIIILAGMVVGAPLHIYAQGSDLLLIQQLQAKSGGSNCLLQMDGLDGSGQENDIRDLEQAGEVGAGILQNTEKDSPNGSQQVENSAQKPPEQTEGLPDSPQQTEGSLDQPGQKENSSSQQQTGDSQDQTQKVDYDSQGSSQQEENGSSAFSGQGEKNSKEGSQQGEKNSKEGSRQGEKNSKEDSLQGENSSPSASGQGEKNSKEDSLQENGSAAGQQQGTQVSKRSQKSSGAAYGTYLVSPKELAVVNFEPVWGEPAQNLKQMQAYIEEAHEKGVKLLVFPELCLTGYASTRVSGSKAYKMLLSNAETAKGKTAKSIAALSSLYDMWIIYGAPEKVNGDKTHAYNAAFICSPEGNVQTYRKISPEEGVWCKPGSQPLILETERYGKIGISLGQDTSVMPELAGYYAAKGCTMLVTPTAEAGEGKAFNKRRQNTLESLASREGLTILQANLLGDSGFHGQYSFPGGSAILQASDKGAVYFAGIKSSLNIRTKRAVLLQNKEGILTNSISFAMRPSNICTKNSYQSSLYKAFYQKLADRKKSGKSLTYQQKGAETLQIALAPMAEEADREKARESMISFIENAAEENAGMILFPELALNGNGESIKGQTVESIAQQAKKYGMYIIFGMKELDNGRYYNTAVAVSPTGTVQSYRKIHLDNDEKNWAQPGNKPLILQTDWGDMGILLGEDGEDYTELGRFYGAMGCSSLIHLTNTEKGAWYLLRRVGSFAQRDGLAVFTCSGEKRQAMAITDHDKRSESIQLNGTGIQDRGLDSLITANVDLNGCGFQEYAFNPRFCLRLYQGLEKESPQELDYITYANLADNASRSQVAAILQEYGISREQADTLLAWADDFNGRTYTPLAEGFQRMLGTEVDYSKIKYQMKETEDGDYLPEANSRLSAFLIIRELVRTNGKIDRADTDLRFDVAAVDTTEQFKMEKGDRANFYSLYNWVPVRGLTALTDHIKAIRDAWKEREIVVDSSKGVSLVNVYVHSTFEDVRIVGHTGVLFETDGKLLFVEKYSARAPFQVSWFHNRAELRAYLLAREDLYEDENALAPIVFENGKVMETD